MKILHLDFREVIDNNVELHYFYDEPSNYKSSQRNIAELDPKIVEQDYYLDSEAVGYSQIGQDLYNWLDGSDDNGILEYFLESCNPGEIAVLAIATAKNLAHIPWELLHNGDEFLVGRSVIPVRWISSESKLEIEDIRQNRALQVLFMASSPIDVEPVLDYEAEEASILKVSKKQNLELIVEESGSLEGLDDSFGYREEDYFDVLHLTGHTDIKGENTYFIAETEMGEADYVRVEDIVNKITKPRLIFLCAYNTGKARRLRTVPSMSESLLESGVNAVLGWDRSTLDTHTIKLAAEVLYYSLHKGRGVTQAVANTYKELIDNKAQDWHLLRLYTSGNLPGKLVTALNTHGRKKAPPLSVATQFLDPKGRVKVPRRENFVGRRRQLQNCLRTLKNDIDKVGVLIHGMGGLGKSSLAARLCDRLPRGERVVWVGKVDPDSFAKKLADRLYPQEERNQLQNSGKELKYRLKRLFEQRSESGEKDFLLVLDDFEHNLELRNHKYVLRPEAATVLDAIVWAKEETYSENLIIITCRYDFEFTHSQSFYKQPLDPLQGAELQKKLNRLPAFNGEFQVDEGLRNKAIQLADGNPRLLESLNEILHKPDAEAEITELEQNPEQWKKELIGSWDEHPEKVKTYPWLPSLEAPTTNLSVGEDLRLTLSFAPVSQSNTELLRIPVNTLEITIYIEAPGFLLQGEHTRTLPVQDGELMECSLNLRLTPLISGDHTIHISIYPGGRLPNLKPVKLDKKVNINKLKKLPLMRELIDRRTIPDPQPDVILHVTLEESDKQQSTGEEQIGLYLTCAALELDRKPLEHLQFTANNLKILQQLTIQAAAVANGSPVDALTSLQAIGVTLFDKLMPPNSQFREYYWELIDLANITPEPLSWLVVSEAKAVLPWELICAFYNQETGGNWYDEFLGEKFIVAHWVGYQGLKLANEAPLLELGLTHYNQYPEQLSRWQKVLGSETETESNQQPGLVALMQPSSLCYGLHILRYTDFRQARQITSYQKNSESASGKNLDQAEELLCSQQLDFTLRRPVVGLSLVDGQQPNGGMGMFVKDNQLEADWILPLMHAGASALVGSRWSVLPESDRLFYRTFYNLIRTGTELGWAVWQARKEVKHGFPHSSDWLAYTYFGHPQCQPYLVRPSQGFTFFEAINPPENDCFEAGKSYQFRASYRIQAPVWYNGRLSIQQISSKTEDLSVMTVGLSGEIPLKTDPLQPVISKESYQTIIPITMPSQETILPLLIRFQKGNEELNTLFLNLKVVDGGQA